MYAVKFVDMEFRCHYWLDDASLNYGQWGQEVVCQNCDPRSKGESAKGIHIIPFGDHFKLQSIDFTNVHRDKILILLEFNEQDILFGDIKSLQTFQIRVSKATPIKVLTETDLEWQHIIAEANRPRFPWCEPVRNYQASENSLMIKDHEGTIRYKDAEGRLHREGGPALICMDGREAWYCHGQQHREDGSADTNAYGSFWYLRGQRHRIGGPAIEMKDGTKEWFEDGLRHRVDGPAVDRSNGETEWFLKGVRHREDGPAIENHHLKRESWYLNGQLHRVDGPAVISPHYQEWWLDGVNYIPKDGGWVEKEK